MSEGSPWPALGAVLACLPVAAGAGTGPVKIIGGPEDQQRVDLWFSRYRCASKQGDVVELRDVDSLAS